MCVCVCVTVRIFRQEKKMKQFNYRLAKKKLTIFNWEPLNFEIFSPFFLKFNKKNISSQGSIDSIIEKNYRNISRQKWWWWWLNNNNIIHIIYKLSSKCWKLCLHLRKIIGFIIITTIIIVEFQFSLHFKKFEPNRIFFRFILLFLFL